MLHCTLIQYFTVIAFYEGVFFSNAIIAQHKQVTCISISEKRFVCNTLYNIASSFPALIQRRNLFFKNAAHSNTVLHTFHSTPEVYFVS